MEYITLANGYQLPMLGYGTLHIPPKQTKECVLKAFEAGYRLIDTAASYQNEKEIGEAIKESKLKREEIYLTTKVWVQDAGYENTLQAFHQSLENLGVDYLDLYLIHQPYGDYYGSWKAMEELYQQGKIKAIGLSNFQISQIQEIMDQCEIPPMIMQVECHPYYPAEHVYDFCKKNHIQLQSWYPLGHGNSEMLKEAIFVELAKKYHKSTVQIILRWNLQMGFGLVPGSKSLDHIEANAQIFDFKLTDEEMKEIEKVNKHIPFYKVTKESLQRLATTKCNFEEGE